jgi:hypothetical protein
MELAADFDAAGTGGYTREPRGAGVAMNPIAQKIHERMDMPPQCIHEAKLGLLLSEAGGEIERLQAIVDSHHEEERAAKTGVWRYIAETYEGE